MDELTDKLKHYQEVLAYGIDNNIPIGKNVIEIIIELLESARFEIDVLNDEIEQLKEDVDYWRNRP